jgi:hypothetical protein
MECDLCLLKRKTNVYIDNEYFIIMDCDSCLVPMAVWKEHTMDIPEPDEQMMKAFLTEYGKQFYKNQSFVIDTHQRAVLDHLHWHARSEKDWKDLNF